MLSPELAQSLILAVGAGCFAEWVRRKAGPPAIFALLYVAFPAAGLACQAAGLVALVEPGKWLSVAITGAITGPLLVTTLSGRSAVGQAVVNVERDRRARWAREDAERAARRERERASAEYHRGRCYAVAEMIEAGA